MNWINELFENKGVNKQAEQTDANIEFQKKAKRSEWLGSTMELDECILRQEEDNKIQAELKVRDELLKSAAYEAFQTDEQVIDQDYLRDVKILSDYQLSEWLAEARARNKNLPYPEMASELKEEAKKSVKSDRSGCEKELLKLHGENTLLDWQKNFKKFSKYTNEQSKADDLYQPQLKDVNDDLSKGGKEKDYSQTDEEHAKSTLGLGREADERTDVTAQPGEVHKDATLVRDPERELRVGTIIRLARSIMSHEGQVLAEGTNWEITGIDEFHYTISANGQKHVISSHDTPKFDTLQKHAAQEEITNHATKEQIITKLAEINSPWAVVIKDGQEVVARVVDEQVSKESEEEKKDLSK